MIKIFSLIFLFSSVVMAKAYYAPKLEMLKESDAIAIVNIVDSRSEKNQGEHFWFAKVASAETEKTLKGNLPSKIEIFWDEDFICERCKFAKGRQLVFLRKEGDKRWACTNWYLSVRPIKKNKVEWYTNNSGTALSSQSLDSVLNDIESLLNNKK